MTYSADQIQTCMLSHICVYNLDMHFNCCNMWNIFLTILFTLLYCSNHKAHPTPRVRCPSVTENREETSFWQTHNTECTGLWQSLGGTTINAENKLRNDKRKQNKQKRNWRESTENNTMVNYSLSKTPTLSRPSLHSVFLNVTVFFQEVRSLEKLGCQWGSSEAEERRVRSGFGH